MNESTENITRLVKTVENIEGAGSGASSEVCRVDLRIKLVTLMQNTQGQGKASGD